MCETPTSCEVGARCDVLECPAGVTEVSTGCCICEDLTCGGDSLPCSDSACVGAEQEYVGDGCCVCGQRLDCPSGQAACDAILCEGVVLYRQDGCCECDIEESCGAGSVECTTASCDGELVEVGGGCCRCESPAPEPAGNECAAGGAPCTLIDCAAGVVDLGDGCCECVLGCDEADDEYDCSTITCEGKALTKSNGCCVCEQAACGPGEAACDRLSCPGAELVDVGGGCCTCSTCTDGLINCTNIVCQGEAVEVAAGCCECMAVVDECGVETQQRYDDALDDILDVAPQCELNEDCTLVALETACRTDCQYPLPREAAEQVMEAAKAWAADNCQQCPQADVLCEEMPLPAEVLIECKGGRCELPR